MTDFVTSDIISASAVSNAAPTLGDVGSSYGFAPVLAFATEIAALSPITSAILGSAPPRPQTGLVFPRGKL